MALPKIDKLSSEFTVSENDSGAVKNEIVKLGQAIFDKTNSSLKSATQSVIGDVPTMIKSLTEEIERGPVDSFGNAMNKLIKITQELGINLYDYNEGLAKSVEEFTGNQEKLEKKLNELREQGIQAEINEKGNAVYKLDQLAPMNGIQHGDAAHSAIGDVLATIGVAKLISKKAPTVWKASMLTMDKTQSLELIKKELLFCTNEYFYGRSRPYVQTFICQHPQYQWPLCFDLKQDPEPYLKMPINELEAAMKKQPKFIRTVRHNKHPVIMNPSYGDKFDEYKLIGTAKLEARAKIIKENKDFAEKIESIKRSEAEEKEQSKSQEDLYNEESIYAKFTTPEDNNIMPEFHSTDWDKKLQVISKFKDERLQYFGKKLLYMEKPEALSKSDYNLIHKDTAKKLLSTNSEKWNTIPRTYSEIDTLRAKFEKQGEPDKLKILDEINAYVEELEKHYSSV